MPRRFLFALGLILLPALLFMACPQHVVKLADEIIPPKDYKPIYMTSTIPYDSVVKAYQASGGAGRTGSTGTTTGTTGTTTGTGTGTTGTAGSTTSGASGSASAMGPLSMDIRNVDDSRYPNEVELRAFIYDTSGRFVMGLAPPYFKGTGDWRARWPRLFDSCAGQSVPIDSFTVTEVRQDKREPYAIAFVLDHSGSMGDEKIRRLRTAVSRTLRIIKKGDMIAAVKFGSRSDVDVLLTDDSARYRRDFQVENISPPGGGGTALYDAALVGIDEVSAAPTGYKRAVILFTDGMDGNSDAEVEAVHQAARAKHVTLYTVAYGQANEEVMRDMASYTGGRMYRIYSYREFPYVFADIYRGLNNYYRITYRPPLCQGIHTATAIISLPEVGYDRLSASGRYDRSLFTPFDPIGSIALVAIEFDYDKATIRPESMPRVQEVADVLRTYPAMELEIRGHTDDRGGDEYNLKLSQDRAEAVANALVAIGIDRSRLGVKGFGESKPLVANDTDENRRKNRRTEFVITKRGR
jgi:VWFA-related protein